LADREKNPVTPIEQFAQWRGDFVAEHEGEVKQLAESRTVLTAAETVYHEVGDRKAALSVFVAGAFPSGASVAAPLHAKIMNYRDMLKGPAAARGAALAAVSGHEARITELRTAIDQIDAAVAASKVTHLRPGVETVRRQPQVVDYDTIQLPRGAA
jgi:hypothetical protein